MSLSAAAMEPVLLVHGGAGDIPADRVPRKLAGVKKAARAGYSVLAVGGCPLDAAQAAVNVMEDDDAFNAGHGSVLNTDGEVEMDALFMDGDGLKAGAVGAIRNVQYPINVARLVMEKTPHVLLVSEGAKRFANEQGVPDVPSDQLITEQAKESLEHVKKTKISTVHELGWTGGVGTVGAVAVDGLGHAVSATSTGGTSGKLPGRVGDTPLVGCGGYADNSVGAVSTTGHGESIIKTDLAHTIIVLMQQGNSAQAATDEALKLMAAKVGNTAGAIALSSAGDVGVGFNSNRMSWAYIKGGELHFGIEPGQHCVEPANEG